MRCERARLVPLTQVMCPDAGGTSYENPGPSHGRSYPSASQHSLQQGSQCGRLLQMIFLRLLIEFAFYLDELPRAIVAANDAFCREFFHLWFSVGVPCGF